MMFFSNHPLFGYLRKEYDCCQCNKRWYTRRNWVIIIFWETKMFSISYILPKLVYSNRNIVRGVLFIFHLYIFPRTTICSKNAALLLLQNPLIVRRISNQERNPHNKFRIRRTPVGSTNKKTNSRKEERARTARRPSSVSASPCRRHWPPRRSASQIIAHTQTLAIINYNKQESARSAAFSWRAAVWV
jgi:hypothetical protein